jgi:hypothetical protein
LLVVLLYQFLSSRVTRLLIFDCPKTKLYFPASPLVLHSNVTRYVVNGMENHPPFSSLSFYLTVVNADPVVLSL